MNVTKLRVEKLITEINTMYGIEDPKHGPKLVERWDWLESGPTRWAIVWEEGPYDWAIEAAWKIETGLFLEPVTSWALGVYNS